MKKFSNILFSMQTMGALILLFAISIGTATFIENDFGPTAAKTVVYNATWFNILLFILIVNLIGRIIVDRMYKLKKLPIFIFHAAFIIILVGSAITRFISYEGMMHIREGNSSNTILSSETYVDVEIVDGASSTTLSKKVMLSVLTPGALSTSANINNKSFSFRSVMYVPNAREVISEAQDVGDPFVVLTVSDRTGSKNHILKYGHSSLVGQKKINFSDNFNSDAVNIDTINGDLKVFANEEILAMTMATDIVDTLEYGSWNSIESQKLYSFRGFNIVLASYYPVGTIDYVSYTGQGSMMDALVVEVSNGDITEEIVLRGGKGYMGEPIYFTFGGANFSMSYGAKQIVLPFSLTLKGFQLERYPVSNSPSSYASEVVLTDRAKDISKDYRIYMNNVLNYRGYRFFQSSYDKDELGTILSVAHDYWGTFFTYVGYFFMSLGMFLAIVSRHSRFALLGRLLKNSTKKINKTKAVATLLIFLVASSAFVQQRNTANSKQKDISKEHAEKFGELIVQSNDGRFKPVNTLSDELIRKISRKTTINGLNSDQIFLGMMSNPGKWQQVPLIKVSHPELKAILKIKGKHASYFDFINMNDRTYKLNKYVTEAYAKTPGLRNKFDNDVLKVDERLNICFMVFNGDMLKILPDAYNTNQPWYSPVSRIVNRPEADSTFLKTVIPAYLGALADGNISKADKLLEGIADYQKKFGSSVVPSESRIKFEILYNKLAIFNNLSKLYGVLGLLMIILLFVEMFKPSKGLKYVINFLIALVVVGFVFQTFGLAIRWYISGHAPWSNGYESMIYIGWITLLAGLIFASGSKMTIAATTILSSIILMVAHLSWMDPEVTNLVPVLKSYWLTIHVSIITASYGFLALSAILGFMNLLLMIMKTRKNAIKMDAKIGELTAINERSVVIGLYLLTIGTFLGGVWANESWGRYWGWDPKETWALVSVLVYSFIAHMHYMPGLKSKFAFNFAALISLGVILMTYFGVNYYLSGLHSYASGDPVPVPNFVYYSIAIVFAITILAYYRNSKFKESEVART
jgi:cytochrome c-type biogenesis protein CcsB